MRDLHGANTPIQTSMCKKNLKQTRFDTSESNDKHKMVEIMENNNECEQNNDDLPLEYFQRWGKRYQKSKMIYIRVRPEEKETILIACKKTGLSISDFVMGASLEAAEAVIKKYRSIFPRTQNVGPQ